jgi:uncharacterized lipoprotein YehR (DUF1307 family)
LNFSKNHIIIYVTYNLVYDDIVKKEGKNMKKKIVSLIITSLCIFSLVACGNNKSKEIETNNNDVEIETESTQEKVEEITTKEEYTTFISSLGYSIKYNETLFSLETKDDVDRFVYKNEDEYNLPIYVSIENKDMSAKDLVDGLVLQSGDDNVSVEEIYLGKKSIEANMIYVENIVEEEKQIRIDYVIAIDENTSLLLEVGSCENVSEDLDDEITMMLDTFQIAN